MPYKDPDARRRNARERARRHRLLNPTAGRAASAKYRAAHLEQERARQKKYGNKRREYTRANRSKNAAYLTAWQAANPDKTRAAAQRYRERHPEIFAGHTAKRRATKSRALPAWANRKVMAQMYRDAKRVGQHVDHIVPLHSPLVCGLHWEGNMQLLPEKENRAKGNSQWPDMWEAPTA